jgi:hypothetical protein
MRKRLYPKFPIRDWPNASAFLEVPWARRTKLPVLLTQGHDNTNKPAPRYGLKRMTQIYGIVILTK